MELDEFRGSLLNDVETRAEAEEDYALSAFVGEASQRLADAEVIENLETIHFRGIGSRQRRLAVDGFDLDDADDSVALAVAEFCGDAREAPRMTGTDARRLLSALEGFLEEAVSGVFTAGREESGREYELAMDLRNRGTSVSRYRLYLLTDHQLGERVREFPSSSIKDVPVDYHVWDIRRFWEIQESARGREPLELDLLEWDSKGLPALEVVGSAGFTTYLTVVPGAMLADLYHRYGSRLLESNVRSFLSARGKINKGIQTTVQSAPEMFLAYNNGITATATGVRTTGMGAIESITDLQIVNGGQTTASLFYVRRSARGEGRSLAGVNVQMKLVVVDPADSAELVPNISRFANSQNRISEADFFSNSPFHVRLEELSRRILAPQLPGRQYQTRWYYERTRGQFQNDRAKLSASEQRRFDLMYPSKPVKHLITKTDAAKYEVSWSRAPHQVSSGAQKNFMAFAATVAKRWEENPESINDEYFRELVSKAILFNELRVRVAKQEWYEQGYLANIVAYALAKLSHEIVRQGRGMQMNFRAIWNAQTTPAPVMDQCVVIAERALGVLTSPSRPVQNVTEWAKRAEAWATFRDLPFALDEGFKSTLLSDIEVAADRSAARARQRADSGIEQQIRVLQFPAEEWLRLQEFCTTHRLITQTQRGVLQKMATGGLMPSERQAGVLLGILKIAKDRGYSSSY